MGKEVYAMYQMTLKRCVGATGIGLHTGENSRITIKPSDEDSGIIFLKNGGDRWREIPFTVDNVIDTNFATTIGAGGERISTVEHIVSALRGMGIDNALVEVDGDEIPIMDGSAAPFCQMIKEAGLSLQAEKRRYVALKKPVGISDDGKNVILFPSNRFSISYTIFFEHPAIGTQMIRSTIDPRLYEKELSAARTFGFMKDVETLRGRGKALGGNFENAVVLNEKGVMNQEGLRFSDEFVRHKVLDAIGDLSLFGGRLLGEMVAFKSGHGLNYRLVKKVLSNHLCMMMEGDEVLPEGMERGPIPLIAGIEAVPETGAL